jgi:hypothetical protein
MPLIDEDMAAMYLTDAKNRRPRPIEQHAELELLLENFRLQTAEAVLAARAMQVLSDVSSLV